MFVDKRNRVSSDKSCRNWSPWRALPPARIAVCACVVKISLSKPDADLMRARRCRREISPLADTSWQAISVQRRGENAAMVCRLSKNIPKRNPIPSHNRPVRRIQPADLAARPRSEPIRCQRREETPNNHNIRVERCATKKKETQKHKTRCSLANFTEKPKTKTQISDWKRAKGLLSQYTPQGVTFGA